MSDYIVKKPFTRSGYGEFSVGDRVSFTNDDIVKSLISWGAIEEDSGNLIPENVTVTIPQLKAISWLHNCIGQKYTITGSEGVKLLVNARDGVRTNFTINIEKPCTIYADTEKIGDISSITRELSYIKKQDGSAVTYTYESIITSINTMDAVNSTTISGTTGNALSSFTFYEGYTLMCKIKLTFKLSTGGVVLSYPELEVLISAIAQ